MSMKRTKKATAAKGSQGEGSLGFNPPTANLPKFEELIADKPDSAFTEYSPARPLVRGDLIAHAKFGKGVVVAIESSRAEILFAEGIKKLGQGVTP
jgi:hypothetical protein